MNLELFTSGPDNCEALGPATYLLRGFALPFDNSVLSAIHGLETDCPFRHNVTPGGFTMSVAMTNCGELGWTTGRRGHRYTRLDPETGRPWPAMPAVFARLAHDAALVAGFTDFTPDACLINRYLPGAKMALHQDKDERDYHAPIVSVSLGMSAIFLLGGHARADKPARIPLHHGDVLIWGGEDRLRFHGVMPLKNRPHSRTGNQRFNLTFRKAG